MILNDSRCSTYEKCPRKYFWSYVFEGQGLAWGTDALKYGTAWHAALEVWYRGKTLEETQLAFVASYGPAPNEEAEKRAELTLPLLADYAKFAEDHDDFTVTKPETEFVVRLGDTCISCEAPLHQCTICECGAPEPRYAGRVDLPVARGSLMLMDHKTAKSVGANYLASFHHSFQMLGYCYGYARATGASVAGYCVNIVKKPNPDSPDDGRKQCPACRNGSKKRISCDHCSGEGRILRTDDDRFVREWVSAGPEDIWRFVTARRETFRRIARDTNLYEIEHDTERAFPMNSQECHRYGACPFISLCWDRPRPRHWDTPDAVALVEFAPREKDYVSLAREEML